MKIFLPGLFALILAIGTVAFTAPTKTHLPEGTRTTAYFALQSADPSDENTLSLWKYDGDSGPSTSCDQVQEVLCTVNAPAIVSNGNIVIDGSQLSSPIDMRHDAAVSDQQFKTEQ
jgi:hypothetical protein